MRIKIVGYHRKYQIGEIVDVSKNEAFGLLDSGVGINTKDMTSRDYITGRTKPKGTKHGYTR